MLPRTLSVLAAAAAVSLSSPSFAESQRGLSDYLQDPVWAQRFNKLLPEADQPDWLQTATNMGTAIPVTLNGKPYLVVSACRQHNCPGQEIAVLFDKETMYGLLYQVKKSNPSREKLKWLNIGGGPESIDGKTILYSATTGSLFNHPDAFSHWGGKSPVAAH